MHQQLTVRFWGVRGSIPCPGLHTARYGGNTPCLEVQTDDCRLIFDGGTGLRVLGQSLLQEMPVEAHIFFTHTHWDHIQGFPFFTPAFIRGNCFHIYGVRGPLHQTIEKRLTEQMLHPNFPVPLQVMGGNLKFYDLPIGHTLELKNLAIHNEALNHPGGSVGYRLDWQEVSVSYITDTEHYPQRLDPNVLKLAHQVDVLIIDSTYTDAEYYESGYSKVGWGHSTWQEAVKIAKAAEVKQLVLFHHDPLHDDEFMDQVADLAQEAFPNTIVAKEGLELQLTPPILDTQDSVESFGVAPQGSEDLVGGTTRHEL
jgi:phosphoribosyl 1,2-cyclic phosphodiesterase